MWASVGKLPSCKKVLTISVTADNWRSRYCFMSQVGWGSSEQEAFEVLPITFWTWSWVICWNFARGFTVDRATVNKVRGMINFCKIYFKFFMDFGNFILEERSKLGPQIFGVIVSRQKLFLIVQQRVYCLKHHFCICLCKFISVILLFSFKNTCSTLYSWQF